MKNKVNTVTNEDAVPSIIKKKVENFKIEGRLVNKKELVLGTYATIKPIENIGTRKIKVTLEVLNFANLDTRPVIPRYGRLISEVLRIIISDGKGVEMEKKNDFFCFIKSPDIDQYCYPVLFANGGWRISDHFTMENGGISITDGNWSTVAIIKEPPNELISVNPNGGMIYSELDKITSFRIPKGNFKESVTFKIQYVTMSIEELTDFQLVYEEQLSPFLEISSLFVMQFVDQNRDIINEEQSLRRAVSIKIPLPDWVISSLEAVNFDTKTTVQDQRKEKLGFYLLQKVGETWYFFDGNMKFTQNSLAFDSKHLGSFIFVKCRENREIRLCQCMSLVENLHSSERGVALVFLWYKRQDWYLWIELVPVSRIKSVRELLESNGLIFIEQVRDCPVTNEPENGRRFSRRLSKKDVILRETIDLYEDMQFKMSLSGEIERCSSSIPPKSEILKESSKEEFNNKTNNNDNVIDLNGFDQIGKRKVTIIEPKDEMEEVVEPDLSYHRYIGHSNAIIVPIKPKDKPEEQWNRSIVTNLKKRSIYQSSGFRKNEAITLPITQTLQTDIDPKLLENADDDLINASKLSDSEKEFNFQCELTLNVLKHSSDLIIIPQQKFTFYIPVETMKDYFSVLTSEEKHELELERLRLENEQQTLESQEEEDVKRYIEPNKLKTVNYSRIGVLSNPRVRNISVTRDPRIISSKSMLAISSVVRQGLTLAVYLSLPENIIAGIGFDAMSQISMTGINNTTYRVLVTWKKMIHINKWPENAYVEQLVDGLRLTGYGNLGELVYEHWKESRDITIDDCQRCLLKKE